MKLSHPRCPKCGAVAIGTVDNCPCTALMTIDPETGEGDYDGESKMHWDGQHTERGDNGLPLVTCGEHQWETTFEEGGGA